MSTAPMRVRFSARDDAWSDWAPALRAACPEMQLDRDGDPAAFDSIIYAPGGDITDFAPFATRGGAEVCGPGSNDRRQRDADPAPGADGRSGPAAGMAEYCAGWALRHHLDMDRYAQDGVWRNGQVAAAGRGTPGDGAGPGRAGAGRGGDACGLGFPVTGVRAVGGRCRGCRCCPSRSWTRRWRGAQILICLLPDTPATRDCWTRIGCRACRRARWLINPGRGPLIDDEALLRGAGPAGIRAMRRWTCSGPNRCRRITRSGRIPT